MARHGGGGEGKAGGKQEGGAWIRVSWKRCEKRLVAAFAAPASAWQKAVDGAKETDV
jgi:hypothetical protein